MKTNGLHFWSRGRSLRAGLLLCLGVFWAGCGGASAPGGKGPPSKPPVPVVVAQAEQRDVPRVIRGIGAVRPEASVVVRAQREGLLQAVRFKEGQTVTRGDLLALLDDRALVAAVAQARAGRARTEAQLTAARVDLERYRALASTEAVSRQMLDQQEALVLQLEAGLAADDANLAAAEVALSDTRIEAPISGRVGLRRVDVGNLVRPSDAEGIVGISQLDPITVVFSLSQDHLPALQPLLAAPEGAPVRAFDRDRGALLGDGRLVTVDNQIDPDTGTLALKAALPNPDGRLWPGQFVTVEIQTDTLMGATVVPTRALRRGPQGAYVFRVDGEAVAVVPVEVTHEDDAFTALGAGLNPGDTVVVDGQSRLSPGSTIKAVEASAPAAGTP